MTTETATGSPGRSPTRSGRWRAAGRAPCWLAAAAGAVLLAGCASGALPPAEEPAAPPAWLAPMPAHQGQTPSLLAWWTQLGDPGLARWVEAAQSASPSLGAARARVAEARAALGVQDDAAGPRVSATAQGMRGRGDLSDPLATVGSAGLQASWVIDLWGGTQAGRREALARVAAGQAGWHEARVGIAAEAARQYAELRVCLRQQHLAEADRDSRRVTAQASVRAAEAGLLAEAAADLARGSAAEAGARANRQAAACERRVKAGVALTALPEAVLRASVAPDSPAAAPGALAGLARIDAVPARVLRQRPDVARAQAEWVAAAEGVGVARAALRPGLSLSGSWLRNRVSASGVSLSGDTWTIGPLALQFPLIGRDGLRAAEQAALARHDAAAQAYRAVLRQAVAEVEQSLITLASVRENEAPVREAARGFARSLEATEARHRVGLASLNELEEARRRHLDAQGAVLAFELERLQAWIGLYLALGGGYEPGAGIDDEKANP